MKTTLVIVLSAVLTAGAFAANQLAAQTNGTDTSQSGVPPATTVTTQDPTTPTAPPPTTTPTTTPTTPTTPTTAIATGLGTVQNIVEITRLVPAGTTAVTAFTVPAGVVLVVTDVIVTN